MGVSNCTVCTRELEVQNLAPLSAVSQIGKDKESQALNLLADITEIAGYSWTRLNAVPRGTCV